MSVSFLQTRRLLFRKFEPTDVPALAAIVADEAVARHVGDGRPLTWEQSALWVDRSRANVEQYGYGTGAVIELATGRLIGWAGFARPDDGPEEIVYGLARDAWGQGYGSELLTGLVTWAEADLGKIGLIATVDPRNLASVRMLQAHGFQLIDQAYLGDPDSCLYRRP